MIYVVVEELIPESQTGQHSNIGTIGVAIGFVLMMVLDVALGWRYIKLQKCDKNGKNTCKNVINSKKMLAKTWQRRIININQHKLIIGDD